MRLAFLCASAILAALCLMKQAGQRQAQFRNEENSLMFVISASAMRSGSSWYLNMTNDMLMASGQMDVRELRVKLGLQAVIANEYADIGKPRYTRLLRLALATVQGHQFVVKTHFYPTRTMHLLARLGLLRTTYIYRDPRDRMLSLLEIGKRARESGETGGPFAHIATFEDALKEVQASRRHHDAWCAFPGTLIVRYEELVRDPMHELRRLRDHLRLNVMEAQLEEILGRYDKKRMKSNERFTMFQKGEIGRYKQVFSSEQVALANQALGPDLLALGYEV